MLKKAFTALCISFLSTQGLWAGDELDFDDLLAADFEDLMNISVVTPSRKSERWFEAPVSTSVLTSKQIRQSGATTIPEALRLVPGLIVREMVNGNFDVHIRGFDGVPPNKSYPDSFNKSTLVMIDHRPVYNHFNGAMLWQELPVEIHDIDRIEVVRGPVGPVYGANAATGVIHLITHKAGSEKNHISWSQGEYHSRDLRARFSTNIDERVSFAGSVHQTHRQRTDDQYFSFTDLEYTSKYNLTNVVTGQPLGQVDERYPDTSLALDKTAINLFMDIKGSNDSLSRISVGTLSTRYQNAFYDTRNTPIGTYGMDHDYIGYTFDRSDLHASLNARKADFISTTVNGFDFSYVTYQGAVEYRFIQEEIIDLSVGAAIDDSRYDALFLGGKAEQFNLGAFTQLKYRPTDALQFSLGIRGDYFQIPDDTFLSITAGANYRFSDDMNGRVFIGRSYQSPFYVETQFDVAVTSPGFVSTFTGNQDMDLVTIDTAEVGFRYSLNENTVFDWEVFVSRGQHWSDSVNTVTVNNGTTFVDGVFEELPVEALQVGSTLFIQTAISEELTWNGYVTVQKTELDDAALFNGGVSDREHGLTPTVYGGFVLNYVPSSAWNANLNAYYLDDQSHDQRFIDEESIVTNIYTTEERWVVNTKVSYQWNDYITTYVNGRNLVNSRQPQLPYLDRLNALWVVGVDIDF